VTIAAGKAQLSRAGRFTRLYFLSGSFGFTVMLLSGILSRP
jgi:hypothetical protein